MGSTASYQIPYADPSSVPDIGYWGQQQAERLALLLGAPNVTSGGLPVHAPGRLVYVTDTGQFMVSSSNAWVPLGAARPQWGGKTQSAYTKTTASGVDLPFSADATRSTFWGAGINLFADGFVLPVGEWEIEYMVAWGPVTGGATIETEAYVTQDIGGTITELPFTHTFAASASGKAANQSARTRIQITSGQPRFRLRFGSGGGNTYVVPNGCYFLFSRVA